MDRQLIIDRKTDPRFAIVCGVTVCSRCMRNIDPVHDEQCMDEYASIGSSHIMAAGVCPHCNLPVSPRLFSVN